MPPKKIANNKIDSHDSVQSQETTEERHVDIESKQAVKKRNRTSKQQRYLKAMGIVRPPTDFQLWCEATKAMLAQDIATGEPPSERRAAYEASLNDAGRCNINVYRGKLWRPESDGGFGVVSAEERAHWRAEYQKVRAEWQERKNNALEQYPKRPDSPYFLFYRDFYARYTEDHPGAPVENVAKEASTVWKEKSSSVEFAHYHTESARLQEEYERKKQVFDRKMADLERQKEEKEAVEKQEAQNKMQSAEQGVKDALAESATTLMQSAVGDVEPARKRIRTANWRSLKTDEEK